VDTDLKRSLDRRGMSVLSLGHMMADMCQGAIPALLPFLIHDRGYSYTQASALVLAATVSSSIVQPVFGHYADRRSLSWLMPFGVLLGTVGVGLVGVLDAYALTFAAIVASGLGVAAFHPEGSRFAAYVSGDKRASGMSLFSLGGNIGFALGPALVTPAVLTLGLSGSLVLIVPGAVVAVAIASQLGHLHGFRPSADARRTEIASAPANWSAFARLNGVIAARTFAFFGLLTFVPVYFVDELGQSEGAGNTALTVLLVGGAAGTALGGPIADRIGRRAVLVTSLALLPPLILAFHAASPALATVIGFFVGMATIATFSVTVVMGQEYLPGRIGMASGITLGLSIGLGGLGAPLLGLVADHWGLNVTLDIVTVLPLIGLALAFTLPRAGVVARRAEPEPEREAATAAA
jgi:FSR family fosmidomycin resistance protein-like MFS transporter